MSEKPKTGGETLTGNSEHGNLEVLTDLKDHFDPDKAKKLIKANQSEPGKPKPTHLESFPKQRNNKPVSEMTPEEADAAYDNIVDRLSRDFVGGKTPKGKKNIVTSIIDAEIIWQSAGKHIKEADAKLASLSQKESQMGLFKKLFTYGERRRERKKLLDEKNVAEYQTRRADIVLRSCLAHAYSGEPDNGPYDYHKSDYEQRNEENESYNQRFFSDENMASISTAMEIRLLNSRIRDALTSKTAPDNSVWIGKKG